MKIAEFLSRPMLRYGGTPSPSPRQNAGSNQKAVRWLSYGAGLLVVIVGVTTVAIILTMRERAIADAARELKSLSLVLADQVDRNFQSIDLVQQALLTDLGGVPLDGSDDF